MNDNPASGRDALAEIETDFDELEKYCKGLDGTGRAVIFLTDKLVSLRSLANSQIAYAVRLEAENARLRGIEQDHLDDWKRIQDAERKCEGLEAEVKRLKTMHKEECDHSFQLVGEIHMLREALEFYAKHPMKDTHIEAEINGGEWIPFGTMAREALKANTRGNDEK